MEPFSQFLSANQNKSHQRDFDIQPIHIQFQTNDSQASDTSYQSSLSSNEENNLGNAEYFREEMSRFFINYPQLLNHELVGQRTNEKSLWGDLAADIINQAKQQPLSLQGIAKRIAFYRQKTQQIDIIDLIVKEKDLILKQLDEQAKMSSNSNLNSKIEQVEKRTSNIHGQSTQNTYYSWKKRHEATIKNSSRKNSTRKLQSCSLQSDKNSIHNEIKDRKFVSIHKNERVNKYEANRPKNLLEMKKNISLASQVNRLEIDRKKTNAKLTLDSKQEANTQNIDNKPSQNSSTNQLKTILKFEPKTEVAKQLLEQIKKQNPNDEVGIKKTIVNFLYRHRQAMKKGIISKSTLNQRLSKLHIEDSKELLLFCPLKKYSLETEMPLNNETNSFLQILNEISTGHLMKYWKLLQQRKL